MKLMYCPTCGDLVLLRIAPRTCACGAATGRYLEDRATVEQTHGSISIGVHNGDLQTAIATYRKTPEVWRPAFCFRAYLNPLCEADVRHVPAGERR
jgi:hypothetical protein